MPAITLTKENFDEEVKQSSLPVLVSYQGSTSTGSIDRVSSHLNGVLKCCKVNAGANPELAQKYKVRCLPTVLLFKDGRVTDTIVGAMRTEQLMQILQ